MKRYRTRAAVGRIQKDGAIRRGAAAIELALTLPLLMMLFLGACDFGRFGHIHNAVINAARAGAGQAARNRPTPLTQGQWEAAIHRVVTNELAEVPGFGEDLLEVTSTSVIEVNGIQRVHVEVRYSFKTLVNWGMIPHETVLQQTTVMRML